MEVGNKGKQGRKKKWVLKLRLKERTDGNSLVFYEIEFQSVGAASFARCRLPICDNWTFFGSCYGSDIISRYWSKSAFSKGGWVTLSGNFRWKETNIVSMFFGFVTKHGCDRRTNRQMDRITIPKRAPAYLLRAVKTQTREKTSLVSTETVKIKYNKSCIEWQPQQTSKLIKQKFKKQVAHCWGTCRSLECSYLF